MGVLAGGRIQDQYGVVRRFGIEFLDNAGNLLQLLHKIVFVVEPPGGVDQQHVGVLRFRLLQRAEGEAGGIGAMLAGDELRTGAIGPDLKLLDRGGAEGVAGGHDHALAVCAELLGQLADGGGLADAVDAGDQHHMRLVRRVDGEGEGYRLQHLRDILGQGLANFLVRHLLVELFARQVGGELGGSGGAQVRHDQNLFQLLQRLVVQAAPGGENAGDAAGQPLGRAGKAGAEAAEKAAAFRFVSHGRPLLDGKVPSSPLRHGSAGAASRIETAVRASLDTGLAALRGMRGWRIFGADGA